VKLVGEYRVKEVGLVTFLRPKPLGDVFEGT
jgi:hypothetical protein